MMRPAMGAKSRVVHANAFVGNETFWDGCGDLKLSEVVEVNHERIGCFLSSTCPVCYSYCQCFFHDLEWCKSDLDSNPLRLQRSI